MTSVSSCFLKVCMAARLLLIVLAGECMILPAYAAAHAQLNPAILVSIQARNKQLEDVIMELSAKTGLNFHYDKADLSQHLKKKVTLHCNKMPIEEVLQLLSRQTGLLFTRRDDKVIVGQAGGATLPGSVVLNNSASLERELRGRIYDHKGNPLPGATILIKNTSKGTQADTEGGFRLNASPVDILVFRSVGHMSREMAVGSNNEIEVMLEENIKGLNEFVVTAMGISKRTQELTYSTQQLNEEDLNRVKDMNVINSLSGKIAGVNIVRSSSGVGGSARVILRGNKSTRENQPLYIIDGVPMANYTPSQPTDIWGQSSNIVGSGGRDGGDGISNLNPDDIESISIMKGPSAAALYGSQAANGVIVITTKRGRPGKGHINFSSDLTLETPLLLPRLQYRYGQTIAPHTDSNGKPQPGSADSWGGRTAAPDHVRPFFNTGITFTNSLSFSGGTEKAQSYFSYSNIANKGILPNSKLDRHTINYRGNLKLLDNRLLVDGNILFMVQRAMNRPGSGLYNNPLTGLYNFPRGQDFSAYRQYEYDDNSRGLPLQNWWNIRYDKNWTGQDDQQNPYWLQYRSLREESRIRGMGSLSLKYLVNNWLSVQARGSFDRSYDQYEMKAYAGTQTVLSPPNGRYTLEKETNTQVYADLMLSAVQQLSPRLQLNATLGSSILNVKAHDRTLLSTNPNANPGLSVANRFSVADISPNALDAQQYVEQRQLQALFASAQLGFRNYLFLDLTGRNDWSSTFAYTPIRDKGYFYYSAGITALLSDMIKLPSAVNFAKLRVSYAKVGNDIAPYVSRPSRFTLQTVAGVTRVSFNTRSPYPGVYLKPEDNRSLEIGTEIRLLDNRINLDLTWYKNNNYQQYMEVPAPGGSGFLFYYLNLGNIQNTGVEATLTLSPIRKKDFRWLSAINYTFNRNKVVKLSSGDIPGAGPDNYFILTDFLVNMFGSFIREGGSWGDIYSNKELYRNEKGQYVIDGDGRVKTSTGVFRMIGNPNPRFMLGWNNTLEYKGFSLSFLVDGKFGGKVMSLTQAILDEYGVSETSAAARDKGGVDLNAIREDGSGFSGKYDAHQYYTTIGGRAGIGEMYIYDATNIRLRELSLSWQVPLSSKWVRNLRIGLTGRNLCFLNLHAPFDPELSMSSGNGLQGIDVFGLPATRSMGMSLRVGF